MLKIWMLFRSAFLRLLLLFTIFLCLQVYIIQRVKCISEAIFLGQEAFCYLKKIFTISKRFLLLVDFFYFRETHYFKKSFNISRIFFAIWRRFFYYFKDFNLLFIYNLLQKAFCSFMTLFIVSCFAFCNINTLLDIMKSFLLLDIITIFKQLCLKHFTLTSA